MRAILILLLLLICMIIPVLLIAILTNTYLKKQNEAYEKELQAQAAHYVSLSKSNYELRRFRHDFNNIRIGLMQSIQDHDYSTAMEMLESSHKNILTATNAILQYDTGNGIVDAILTDKQIKAREDHITIKFDGSVPPNALSAVDLCVLFGNTVDNAVEACEKLPKEAEKEIKITSRCNSGFIFIQIENPTAEAVVIQNNMIDTTKADRSSHGYGLYSLKQTVKKYDGEIALSCDNNVFKVNLDLSIV
jgi:sensor histidine kinase regulating citrate/malate metabolism